MKLNDESLKDRAAWEKKGVLPPNYDRARIKGNTKASPTWIHFGAGNIFRAFPAVLQQRLLNAGLSETGIIACEGFDEEVIDTAYAPYDNLSVAVTLKEGGMGMEIVGSVTEALKMSSDKKRLHEIFANPSLQMATFTITEKGYPLPDADGRMPEAMRADMGYGPEGAQGFIGVLASLCYSRFIAGGFPLALVSMDNCSENGSKLQLALSRMALGWAKHGFVPDGFLDYLNDYSRVGFPWTMIDKITPRPSGIVLAELEKLGVEGLSISFTSKQTCISGFVNAEEIQYLVIEDTFPAGRPPLERAGAIFTDRGTVGNVEKMKVGACLNPLHTMLGVFGSLLGYTYIYETMRDPALLNLISRAGHNEAMPYVPDPGVIQPALFIKEVIETRFPNPYIPDTTQRIMVDSSQAIPPRFGETLKKMKALGHDATKLVCFPFFFAGWLRYFMGVGDNGAPIEFSPDPMLPELSGMLGQIKLGGKGPFTEIIKPVLSNEGLFGVSLYDNGLAEKTEAFFEGMVTGPGAVRRLLDEYFG